MTVLLSGLAAAFGIICLVVLVAAYGWPALLGVAFGLAWAFGP